MKTKIVIVAMALVLAVLACKKTTSPESTENYSDVPQLPQNVYDYNSSPNDYLATLGRVLFYDRKLSLNNSVACGSCHQQAKAFCDNKQFSVGLEDQHTARNTPSIFAKGGRMFWDGRASGINDLVLKPVQNHVEMKFSDLGALASKLAATDYYPDLFKKAFGSSDVTVVRIQSALAEFVKNFDFSVNRFNNNQLNALEKMGMDLFQGKALCSNCHNIGDGGGVGGGSGYGFTDDAFNIGLDLEYTDNGLGKISGDPKDNGKFMIPVLLNVAYTAPYMHDGRYKTLEEVVEHYNSGIQNHPNLSVELRDIAPFENMSNQQIMAQLDLNHNGEIDEDELSAIPPVRLNLNADEKKALVAFLKSLSDPGIFSDDRFSNPFRK
jgi:cytochrome c peroxidase